MPWKEIDSMDQKIKFVIKSFDKRANFTQLCKEFGISTKTGYKWRQRFIEGGEPALIDLPRTPHSNAKSIDSDLIYDIIKIKLKKKSWGAPKIHATLAEMYPIRIIPHERTIGRILRRTGFIKNKKRRRVNPTARIQCKVKANHPNHIWTVDFKGWWYTPQKEICEPLTVRDDYSKYILCIKILEKGDISCVKAEFEKLFKKYGLPEVIRSDNGPPFANAKAQFGLTKLAAWWLSLGIRLDRIDPGKPFQNGSHERMHLDMKKELEGKIDGDLNLHQSVFEVWRKEYNTERPHQALDMKKPAQVYTKSKNKYKQIDELLYPHKFLSRQVNNRGYTFYKGRKVFLSNAFNGFNVGLEVKTEFIKVWFANNFLGQIDKSTFIFTPNQDLVVVTKQLM